MELEVTWQRAGRIWWSYLWRSLLAMAGAIVAADLLCLLIIFVMDALHYDETTIKFVVMPMRFLSILLISIVPLKFILGKEFGEFRLVLLAKPSTPPASDPARIPPTT